MIKKIISENEIKMFVEEILGHEVTNMPFDFLFRETARQYPKINHEELGLPGVYHKTEDPKIFIPDDGVLEMDHLESVLPDDEGIFRQSAINSEQETGHITNAKKDKSPKTLCFQGFSMELMAGFEPATSSLPRMRSTD